MNHEQLLNPTLTGIPPSGIRRFFDIADTMDDVISLTVGEPDFVTPWAIREEGIYALEQGKTHYTSNSGLPALRAEISNYYAERFNSRYDDKDEIIVTVGGSEGIDLALRAIIRPGEEVILHEPSFVCYAPLISLAGGVPVILETKAENNFRITAAELAAKLSAKTKAIILSYPNNPTGAVMDRASLEALAELVRGRDVYVLSDEIYAEMTYTGEPHVSISALPGMHEHTIVVSGFSKAFAMTGWRLGYLMAPAGVMRHMTKIHQYAIMSAPTPSQYGALEAMKNSRGEIEMMVREYNRRRRLITDAFRSLGMPCFEPYGAFYIFPDIRRFGLSSEEFCRDLLNKQKVALVPGSAFGKSGEGFVRVSYAYSIANISEGIRRIKAYINA